MVFKCSLKLAFIFVFQFEFYVSMKFPLQRFIHSEKIPLKKCLSRFYCRSNGIIIDVYKRQVTCFVVICY